MRKMKDSEIEWIGKIPEDWKIIKNKYLFKYVKKKAGINSKNFERLSLTLKGVLKRSKEDREGLQPEEFDSYQILEKENLVFKLIDLENIQTSRVGLSPYTGIVSPAYIVLEIKFKENLSKFYFYFFFSMYYRNIFNSLGGDGVRSSISYKELLDLPNIQLPSTQQIKISEYLYHKCGSIEKLIKQKENKITKLEEYKKSLIYECVTGKREV